MSIEYSDGALTFEQKDNCLLSFELGDLTEAIDAIISGKETGLLMTLLEPYLMFSLTQVGELYAFQIRFVYDTSGNWKDAYICQGMSLSELKNVNAELKAIYEKYPYRKIEKEL